MEFRVSPGVLPGSSKGRHRLVPNQMGKIVSLLPLRMMLSAGLFVDLAHQLERYYLVFLVVDRPAVDYCEIVVLHQFI